MAAADQWVRYYCASSLDGYIAESDDSIDWLTGYEGSFEDADSAEGQGGYESFYEEIGALAMGSVTYEWVLEHASGWPYAGKPAWVPPADPPNTLKGYVCSLLPAAAASYVPFCQ